MYISFFHVVPRPGKHGASKVLVNAEDVFLGTKSQCMYYWCDYPEYPSEITKKEYLVLGVDEYAYGSVDILDEADSGRTVAVPPGPLGVTLREYYQQERDGIMVTVLEIR